MILQFGEANPSGSFEDAIEVTLIPGFGWI